LLNPNQIRWNGLVVQDNPFEIPMYIKHPDEHLDIAMDLRGAVIGFETHCPSDDELERCRVVELTSDREWKPQALVEMLLVSPKGV